MDIPRPPKYQEYGPYGVVQSITNLAGTIGNIALQSIQRQEKAAQALKEAQYNGDVHEGRLKYKTLHNQWQMVSTDIGYEDMPTKYSDYMLEGWEKVLDGLHDEQAKNDLQLEFEEFFTKKQADVISAAQSKHGEVLIAQYENSYDTLIDTLYKEPDVLSQLYTFIQDHVGQGVIGGKKAADDFELGLYAVMENRYFEQARTGAGYDAVINAITESPPEIKMGDHVFTFSQNRIENLVGSLTKERDEKRAIHKRQQAEKDKDLYAKGLDLFRKNQLTFGSIEILRKQGLSAEKSTQLYDRLESHYERQSRLNEAEVKAKDKVIEEQNSTEAQRMKNSLALRIGHEDPAVLNQELNDLVRSQYGIYFTESEIGTFRNKIDNASEAIIPEEMLDYIEGLELGPAAVMDLETRIYKEIVRQKYPGDGTEEYLSTEDYKSIVDGHVQPLMEERLKEINYRQFDIWSPDYQHNFGSAPSADYQKDIALLDRNEYEYKLIIDRIKRGGEYSEEEKANLKDAVENKFAPAFRFHFRRFPPKEADVPGRGFRPSVRIVHGVIPVLKDASGQEWAVDIPGKNETWRKWDSENENFYDYGTTTNEPQTLSERVNVKIQQYAQSWDHVVLGEEDGTDELWLFGLNAGDSEYTKLERIQ